MRVWPGNQFRIYTPRSRFELVFRGALPPAGPSVPGATFGPGANPGETYLTIDAPPDVWGDSFVQGDGLGEILGYGTRIAGVLALHDTTVLPITRVSTGHAEGLSVLVEWWAIGSNGRAGLVGAALVYPAATLAAPSVPPFAFVPGGGPGEVDLVVAEPPASLGDGLVAGDGAGTFTGLVIQIGAAAPVTYDATTPREVTSGGHTPGASVSATVQALGYGGRPGALGFATTSAAADPAADFIAMVDPATGYVITSGGVVWVVRAPEEI